MRLLVLALAIASCSATMGDEPGSGLTVFRSMDDGVGGEIAFTLHRRNSVEPLEPHRGPSDPQGFDYSLEPNRSVSVRAAYSIDGREMAALVVTIPAKNDYTYSVYAHVGRENPTATCMGCMDVQSTLLESSQHNGARLWLYTSFNGITHPIMF